MTLLADVLAKIVAAFLAFWAGERHRADDAKAAAANGAAEAESETEDVIAEIADERSKVVIGGDARAIADRLRGRKSRPGSDGAQGPLAG